VAIILPFRGKDCNLGVPGQGKLSATRKRKERIGFGRGSSAYPPLQEKKEMTAAPPAIRRKKGKGKIFGQRRGEKSQPREKGRKKGLRPIHLTKEEKGGGGESVHFAKVGGG